MNLVSISSIKEQCSRRQRRFFDLARQVSFKSDARMRLGAVIVQQGNVISVGYNRNFKTHPISKAFHRTIHAEMDAIIGVDRASLEGATIFVYREDRHGIIKMAKPCEHCQLILNEFGIKKVFYTTQDGVKL